jgi:uncharacterized protein YhbP (UPF0306 family)
MDNIQNFIKHHNTMTLATRGEKDVGAAAVFYAPIKESNSLLFVSKPKSEHITNLENNNKCAATIQEDGLKWDVIKGLQIKGIVIEAEDKYWNTYFKRFPYIKDDEALSKALKEVVLYEFQISWARLINNEKGFGNRTENRY